MCTGRTLAFHRTAWVQFLADAPSRMHVPRQIIDMLLSTLCISKYSICDYGDSQCKICDNLLWPLKHNFNWYQYCFKNNGLTLNNDRIYKSLVYIISIASAFFRLQNFSIRVSDSFKNCESRFAFSTVVQISSSWIINCLISWKACTF